MRTVILGQDGHLQRESVLTASQGAEQPTKAHG